MTLLAISDITKSFAGHKALDHVTLDIRQGEFISLLGPSGCGKTTLLRTVAGFMTADKGRILIDGDRKSVV